MVETINEDDIMLGFNTKKMAIEDGFTHTATIAGVFVYVINPYGNYEVAARHDWLTTLLSHYIDLLSLFRKNPVPLKNIKRI